MSPGTTLQNSFCLWQRHVEFSQRSLQSAQDSRRNMVAAEKKASLWAHALQGSHVTKKHPCLPFWQQVLWRYGKVLQDLGAFETQPCQYRGATPATKRTWAAAKATDTGCFHKMELVARHALSSAEEPVGCQGCRPKHKLTALTAPEWVKLQKLETLLEPCRYCMWLGCSEVRLMDGSSSTHVSKT